jgi:RimJ/RimL family protein N-acetyltransferase
MGLPAGPSKESMLAALPVSQGSLTLRRWTRAETCARSQWPPYPAEYSAFDFALAGASQDELDRHFLIRDQDPGRIPLAADCAGQQAFAYFALHEIDWEKRTVGNVGFRLHPDWCGRGFGPRILRLAAAWCRDCGIHSIRLDVAAANTRAVRCYEKAGMRRIGEFWREDRELGGIDIARPEHDALRPHFRIEDGVPKVRFWWMELKIVALRSAMPADSGFAYRVREAAFRTCVEAVWGWDEAEQRRLHSRRFASQQFRVIRASGVDVGVLAAARGPDCVKVNQVFILPERQGGGIGGECMRQVIEEADAAGLPVRLRVLKVNPRAAGFFQRLGFRSAGESETHVFMERGAAGVCGGAAAKVSDIRSPEAENGV